MADLVALQTMLPKFDSPFEQQGKALQLRQMMNAGQQADFEAQQRQQAAADDQSYRAAMQANPTGGAGLLSALAGSGNYKGYAAAQKADLDQRKGNADIDKDKATTNDTNLKALNQAFTLHRDQINMVNDPQTAAQWVAAAYKDPALGPLVSQSGPLEAAIARIPTDPAGFAKWKLQAGTSADEYVKRTTVDANTAANNQTSITTNKMTNDRIASEGTANRANAIKVQTMIGERQPDGTKLAPEDVTTMAQQYIAGDKSVLQGLGRGAQGAEDIRAVRAEIGKQLRAGNLTGADQAAKIAEYGGLVTGLRATGNISARIENAAEEAKQLAPLALESSRLVSRSGFLPFGKMQDMFDVNSNNTDLATFATRNLGLATAYASAMARGNKPTVSDNEHARALLSTAKDQPAYAATVAAMQGEIEAAQRAPKNVRAHLSSEISGRSGNSAAPAIPAGWSVKEH